MGDLPTVFSGPSSAFGASTICALYDRKGLNAVRDNEMAASAMTSTPGAPRSWRFFSQLSGPALREAFCPRAEIRKPVNFGIKTSPKSCDVYFGG